MLFSMREEDEEEAEAMDGAKRGWSSERGRDGMDMEADMDMD